MRLTLAVLLMLSAAEISRGDVGLVFVDKDNQQQRSGDRLRISVSRKNDPNRTVRVFVKNGKGELPVRADLRIGDRGKPEAMIPVKMTLNQTRTGFYISLEMTREFAKRSELSVLVDFTKEDKIHAGTQYHIDLASYLDDP